VVTIRLP